VNADYPSITNMSSPTPSATSTVEAGNSGTTTVAPVINDTSGKTASRAAASSPVVVGAKTKNTPSTPITASSPTPSATSNSPPSPLLIGKSFIKQYYQVLSNSPQHIKRFYQPNTSILSHSFLSSVPAESKTLSSTNQSDIFEWAVSSNESSAGDTEDAGGRLCFDFGRGAIDAQETIQGGILLVVTGHMKLPDEEKSKAFVHTFFLNNGAPAGKKRQFYVHNDILRIVAESGVEEVEEQENVPATPNQQEPVHDSTTLTTETPTTVATAVAVVPAEAVQDAIPDKTKESVKPAAQAQDIIQPPADKSTVLDEKPPLRKGANAKSNAQGSTNATDNPPVKNTANKTESKRKNSNSSIAKADSTPNTNTNKTTVDGGGGSGGGKKKNHERSNSNDVSPAPKEEKKSKKNKGKGGRSRKDRGRSPSSDQTDLNAANTANATITSSKQKDSKNHNASSSNNKPKVPGSWAGVVAGAGGPATTAQATSNSHTTPPSPSRPSPVAAAAAATAAAHLASSNSAAVEESKDGMDMDGIEKPSTANKADSGHEASASNNSVNSRGGHPPRSNTSSNQQSVGNNVTQRTADATIFLKNIPDKTKEADIRSIFEPYAATANQKILGITLHASRGFCFVDFDAKLVVDAILKDVEASKEANEASDSNGKDSKFYIYGKFLDVGRKVQVDKGRGGGSSQHRYRNRSASPGNGTYHKPRGGGHHHRRNSPRGGNRPTGGQQQQQQQQTQRNTTK